MTTPADIVNQAVQLVAGYDNQSPVTGSPPYFDQSVVGLAAGIIYNNVVQAVTRQLAPEFARTVTTDLELSANTPPLGFNYEYLYPTDGAQLLQVIPATFADENDPRPVDWTVGNAVVPYTTATGTITFPSNPTNGSHLLLNGVSWEFVSGSPVGNQTQIGGTLAFTIATLVNNLNDSVDPDLSVATYSQTANGEMTITYGTPGPAGNAYTLSADSPYEVSAATLLGGSDTELKVIWANEADAQAVYTSQPNEGIWDALFTQTVIRMLASELQMALAARPETSEAQLKGAMAFAQGADSKVDA